METVFSHGAASRSIWGKNPLGITSFGPQRSQSHQCYGSFGLNDFNGGWWLNTVSIREIFTMPVL